MIETNLLAIEPEELMIEEMEEVIAPGYALGG
jgi:hypothetical protein